MDGKIDYSSFRIQKLYTNNRLLQSWLATFVLEYLKLHVSESFIMDKRKIIMEEKFIQKLVVLNPEESTGKLMVEKLWELMEDHPYKEKMYKEFEIEKIKNEVITIDFIDIIYKRIRYFGTNYKRKLIRAEIKHINLFEEMLVIDGEKKRK